MNAKTIITMVMGHLTRTTKRLPTMEQNQDVENKYSKHAIWTIGIKTYDPNKGDFNNKVLHTPLEVSASPFYLANPEMKAILLDTMTSSLPSSHKLGAFFEGIRRFRVAVKEIEEAGWKICPMKHLRSVRVGYYNHTMILVSKKNTVNVSNKQWSKFGDYCSVKGMKGYETIKTPVIRIPAQNDGCSFTTTENLYAWWPKMKKASSTLAKIAGYTNFKGSKQVTMLKGTLLGLNSVNDVASYFPPSYFQENEQELKAAGLPMTPEGMYELATTNILSSDNELKLNVQKMGEEREMSLVIYDYQGYKVRSTMHLSMQLLFRVVFEKPEIANTYLEKCTRLWVKMIGTARGWIRLCVSAINDVDEDDTKKWYGMNKVTMAASINILRFFPLAVDSYLMKSMIGTIPAVISRLSRITVPGTSSYPIPLPSVKRGEVMINAATAAMWGQMGMHEETKLNSCKAPIADGEKVYIHRYPSTQGSLKYVTVRINSVVPYLGVAVNYTADNLGHSDAGDMALDFDGDKIQAMRAMFGPVVDRPYDNETSEFLWETDPVDTGDVRLDALLNKTYSRNIGVSDTLFNQIILNKGAHSTDAIRFMDVHQRVITSGKKLGEKLVALDSIQSAIMTSGYRKIPYTFQWLRGKFTSDDPMVDPINPELVNMKAGVLGVQDYAWPTHMHGMLNVLNQGFTSWFQKHNHKADEARWVKLQNQAKKVVDSKVYDAIFDHKDLRSDNPKFRYFIDRLHTPEMKTLNDRLMWFKGLNSNDPKKTEASLSIKAFVRDIITNRVNESIARGNIDASQSEELGAVVRACILCRFWATGFFMRTPLVETFDGREIDLTMKAIDAIVNGIPFDIK